MFENKLKNTEKPLIKDVLPELGAELKKLLKKTTESHLAEHIDSLRIFEKCGCGVRSCASFYTGPKPEGSYGKRHKNLFLSSRYGFLILDIVNDEIKFIEIHDRPKNKKLLDQI